MRRGRFRGPLKPEEPEHRINERIRAPKLRVIDENGKQIGIMEREEALNLAYEKGLDLVEVAPNANPPVARIMDYGKFKFIQKKKEKETRKSQVHQQKLKEVKLRLSISDHDLDVKMRHAREFLEDGYKVQVRIFLRGREIEHKERAKTLLQKVISKLEEVATYETKPFKEGSRDLITIFTPKSQSKP